jgi:Domain of unknown function (DUF4349)
MTFETTSTSENSHSTHAEQSGPAAHGTHAAQATQSTHAARATHAAAQGAQAAQSPTGSGSLSRRRGVLLPVVGLGAVVAILGISACGGGGFDNSGSAPSSVHGQALMPGGSAGVGRDISDSAALPAIPGAEQFRGFRASKGSSLNDIRPIALERAQIKTARIDLRSSKVASVVSDIEGIAVSEGGFIDSENTATNTRGVATSSTITLRVPVDRFETAVSAVSALGQLASKKTTTEDVTGQVADVASRVQSAKDSISQLRILFNRATKLGDIITLESQLSSREADLEALEAQQRALNDQTSLSTISVGVTRPPVVTTKPKPEDTSGFVGGLRQGWDALVDTFAAVSHSIGAVLPLGIVAILLGCLAWVSVRRIPRHRPDTSG